MIFKIKIGEKELYFSNKLRVSNEFSKLPEGHKYTSEKVYKRTGKYSHHYDVLEKIYNEFSYVNENINDLDVQFSLSYKSYKLIIYHGDIEISNSENEKHPIKELYSSFKIEHDEYNRRTWTTDFRMFRGKYSAFELLNEGGYLHSHCSTYSSHIRDGEVKIDNNFIYSHDVCLGSSELGTLLGTRHNSISAIDLTTIFMYIDTFVRWESLEGGPYRKLNDMYGSTFGVRVSTDITNTDSMIRHLIHSGKLDIHMRDNKINSNIDSIIRILTESNILKNNRSKKNHIYDLSKKKKYMELENSSLLSQVFFNGKYVNIICEKMEENEYDQYIDLMFNNIDNNIVFDIKSKIDELLSVYSFDKEYEIVN